MKAVRHRVVLTDEALADVEGVLQWYTHQRATDAGTRWLSDLMSRLETLESDPDRCPQPSEADAIGQDVRELLFGRGKRKYRLFFKIEGRTVSILRVWHSSRDRFTPGKL